MCAIVGIYGESNITSLESILSLMQKRGPDGSYLFFEENFVAGMNRLSINDLYFGEQPFMNIDSSIVVLFNGEIYNYRELKKGLEQKGYSFKGHCDGEILPFLYEEYGVESFSFLDGMFGIMVYDKRHGKIILARDGVGEKPLYYAKCGRKFAFSTLIKPLKEYFGSFSLNPQALWDFFTFGFIPEPQSVYNEVKALKKGHYLVFDCQSLEYNEFEFWQKTLQRFSPICQDQNVDLVGITKEIVTKSIQGRLMSDVPIGAFLSGGLDSSIVATLAQQSLGNLTTFNIAFLDNYDPYCGFADESSFAMLVAKNINSQHFTLKVDAKNYQNFLKSFIQDIDQPFGAISGIGVKMIARKARELGIKVLLSGDGADEYFGGYTWYPKLAFNDSKFITKEKPKGWHYYAFESEKKEFLNLDFFEDLDSRGYFPRGDSSPITFIDFDREFYLPNEMMTKLDRMCMSESIEGRAIFVSPGIASFTQQLDYETLLRNGEKWLLKEAFKSILPQEILQREKHGFNVPIDYWIKNDWFNFLREILSKDSALFHYGIIREDSCEKFIKILYSNERRVGNVGFYLIALGMWLEI
ncbi:asparagine synthase (glutamine-hydrolyzing) [Helicobacter sp. 14348-15]|uniref:asparagine synthase (glutamine-hydrolyzing) n=1 Tax=Helicobacter colisuis TaxID=2949739 RepID=UPI00202B99B1|nr:asparagine synthase (glutamine-hydrolyzing) [Helicobacter colisuis]MCL9821299.1 asparagine synthase (glutamine-hydrolyzing) [Helicobacter colisuis]